MVDLREFLLNPDPTSPQTHTHCIKINRIKPKIKEEKGEEEGKNLYNILLSLRPSDTFYLNESNIATINQVSFYVNGSYILFKYVFKQSTGTSFGQSTDGLL